MLQFIQEEAGPLASAPLAMEGAIDWGVAVQPVEQSNFYDHHVPRMKDVPPMHIEVIQTDNHPTGAGQMATPLVAPAISAAVAELTGVRLRHTPFLPDRVKKALG